MYKYTILFLTHRVLCIQRKPVILTETTMDPMNKIFKKKITINGHMFSLCTVMCT